MPFIINDYVSHFFYEDDARLKKNLGASAIIFFYMNNYGVNLVYIPENILI